MLFLKVAGQLSIRRGLARVALSLLALLPTATALISAAAEPNVSVRGQVVDSLTGQPLAARVYLRSAAGRWFFPRSDSPAGSAIEYRKERQPGSTEMHTTLSAHPFVVELPPGDYTLTVERGKEYLPLERQLHVEQKPLEVKVELRRWIDMAARGWYSGDTHVHRLLEELPNVMLAEDLNVALPLSYWVTAADTPPKSGNKNTGVGLRAEPILVDATHVIYPVNTEYEIFTVGEKRHTLGAVFILGHRTPLEAGVPPVANIGVEARRQGALLDLDKHSWPWSLMLVPVMQVDLFELANNHVWRTEFGFRQWTIDTLPRYMHVETDTQGLTEWGWIDFGWQTYYALLNCGFRLRPTAGTASGVHPVPLGFGRVYVHQPQGFSYQSWMRDLNAGRSFVTTGPMLLVQIDGQDPGHTFAATPGRTFQITGTATSAVPLDRIEIVVSGQILQTLAPANRPTPQGGYESPLESNVTLDTSCWIALRTFEKRPDGRVRFAHTSPVHVDFPDRPLRPRREEVAYFIERIEQEIERNRSVLPENALAEYGQALRAYQQIMKTAR
jgi:hypothetical protein